MASGRTSWFRESLLRIWAPVRERSTFKRNFAFDRPATEMLHEPNQAAPMLQSIDRISVLDGAIVTVGWCEGATPLLVLNGEPLPNQVCARYGRPDVAAAHGRAFANSGFRLAAVTSGISDNAEIGVRFADRVILTSAVAAPEARLPEVLSCFCKTVSQMKDASLIEIGSRSRSGNSYRGLFPSLAKYVGTDIAPGPNVDVIADAHTLSRHVTERFDFAFSVSVFEHLIMPWTAACELNKVLKTGGLAYIQSHPAWPLHEQPWDFFRFSKDAWNGLFNRFTGFEIVDSGYDLEASIVPRSKANAALQGLDVERTFLLSGCIARKTGEPIVDWSVDPSTIYDLNYSHGTSRT